MKKKPQSLDSLSRVIDTINDRLRVPWISGARQVDISVIPPLILLPVFLHIAALHYLLGILMLTAVPSWSFGTTISLTERKDARYSSSASHSSPSSTCSTSSSPKSFLEVM